MPSVTVTKYLPEIRILTGLPGSGKSREAEEWVKRQPDKRVRVNYDDLRLEMFGKGWRFNRTDEDKMKSKAMETADTALQLGMSVVVDNTNLSKKARQPWVDLAAKHSAHLEIDEIDTDVWTCIERDRYRKARVGRAVIERMALFNGLIDFSDPKTYPYDAFVICDLDGTLCNITHRRHFVQGEKKDWKSFFANVSGDTLNEGVADLLELFADDGYGILLVSGRPITPCGIPTEDWLKKHAIRYDHLFMREGGDSRSDVIVKQEILDLLPKDRVDFVLDDRDSVVEMWRKNGLLTLQVAKGDF